jgi:hypothetical protein
MIHKLLNGGHDACCNDMQRSALASPYRCDVMVFDVVNELPPERSLTSDSMGFPHMTKYEHLEKRKIDKW